jgi:para-aminobenzoate synthetase component 1
MPGRQTTDRLQVPVPDTGIDPFSVFLSMKGSPYPFFLDSGCDAGKLGRFSFMGCDPFLVLRSKGRSVELEWGDGRRESLDSDPFETIRDLMEKYRCVKEEGVPFTGGAVGYFSYDLKGFIENLPDTARDDLSIPDAALGFYDTVITYDNLDKRYYISGPSAGADRFHAFIMDAGGRDEPALRTAGIRPESNFSKDGYMEAVRKAKDYIKKGDIYQVNLSQRFSAPLTADPLELYSRLRSISPAPFASYLDFGDVILLSSSPERFLLKRGSYVETRPIKGTRPRGSDPSSDSALESELKSSRKDAAEHIMIVDLERNDLGRICEYGTVKQTESMVMERYANVFHLVSTVSGTLRKGVDAIGCLRAAFPGGSITGAPKIRSMEIIDELEGLRRSVYTGAIGYLAFNGDMDTSIVIRTFVIKGGKVYFQAGGGIVADSDPEKEYEETLQKASALMRALGADSGITDTVAA